MLGGGRPFVIEMKSCRKALSFFYRYFVSYFNSHNNTDVKQMQDNINANETSVNILNLTLRNLNCMIELKESEIQKCKAYQAFCTSLRPITK